jgi:hypothetical protein
MCDVRSILQPNIGAARDDPGNISAQLAQQGQVEPHCTCWKNAVSSNSSLQRRTSIALMRCTHTA